MSFALKQANITPSQYAFFNRDGLFEFTDRESEALQLARRADAESLVPLYDEALEVVEIE